VEDLDPYWPVTDAEESGIFFTCHDVDIDLKDAEYWAEWIQEVIEDEGHELARVDYIFCSDEFLLEVNRTHLDHDFYTDIITFPLNANPIMAEIYISIERVRENAITYSRSFEDELLRVMVHGILHLVGYDDHEEEDVQIIRKKEEEYVKRVKREE
jgi:rRNA maturation RNase YbeY